MSILVNILTGSSVLESGYYWNYQLTIIIKNRLKCSTSNNVFITLFITSN